MHRKRSRFFEFYVKLFFVEQHNDAFSKTRSMKVASNLTTALKKIVVEESTTLHNEINIMSQLNTKNNDTVVIVEEEKGAEEAQDMSIEDDAANENEIDEHEEQEEEEEVWINNEEEVEIDVEEHTGDSERIDDDCRHLSTIEMLKLGKDKSNALEIGKHHFNLK